MPENVECFLGGPDPIMFIIRSCWSRMASGNNCALCSVLVARGSWLVVMLCSIKLPHRRESMAKIEAGSGSRSSRARHQPPHTGGLLNSQ